MKKIVALVLFALSISAFAATKKQINEKASSLLIKNIASLSIESDDGVSDREIMGHLFYKLTKVTTVCKYNTNDALYNCRTSAINELDEVAMFFEYQLEGEAGKLPTGFFFFNVKVTVAG